MKKVSTIRRQLCLCLLISLSFMAQATHNRAGEITYQWLYGYTYKIKITTYTNISGPNLADRCYDTLSFGDGIRASVPRTNGTTTALCGGGPLGPFDGVAITSTIKKNEYETTHTYPGPGSYKMSMEDPNRNAGIINIPNSVNQVFYIESYLVISTFFASNNSPVLTFPPIDQGCLNQCFYHNPGAYDVDGDSLSYDTTYCRGTQALACPGYSYPSGNVYSIDPLTGTLTWCSPALQGEYNMAMIIKEWRKDIDGTYHMIGYIIRDMQVDIGSCGNTPPMISVTTADHYVLAGNTINTAVSASDQDGNTIALSANGGPFAIGNNTAQFNSTPATSSITGTFNWNTDYTNVRRMPYQVTLKVKDNGTGINLVHFKTFTVKVIPQAPVNVITTAANDFIRLNWSKPATYTLSGNNAFLKYKIYRKTGVSNWVHSPSETVPPAYTGYTCIGYTNNNVADTLFFDFNNGQAFPPGQQYSYVVVAECKDGSTSYVSNVASNEIFVGMEETHADDISLHVFPNPTSDLVTISFRNDDQEPVSISLLDLSGKVIENVSDQEALTGSEFRISLKDIAAGTYVVAITHRNKTTIAKIIKH